MSERVLRDAAAGVVGSSVSYVYNPVLRPIDVGILTRYEAL